MNISRQTCLNTLVRRLYGKGRSTDVGGCIFIKAGHPGCAFGCLPGFRKAARGIEHIDDCTITDLLEMPSIVAWFGLTTDESDLDFLGDFQLLHDDYLNWYGKTLRRSVIEEFAKKWKLKAPANPKKRVA